MNVTPLSISFSLSLCIDLVIDSLHYRSFRSKVHSNDEHEQSHLFYEEIKSIECVSLTQGRIPAINHQ